MNLEIMRDLHDAALVEINSEGVPLELKLKLRTEKNKIIELNFVECEMFRLADFSNQNIVSRAVLFNEESKGMQGLKELILWTTSLSDSSTYLSSEKVDEVFFSIRGGGHSLIYLEPSCGAEFSAIYKILKVSQAR